MAVTSIHPIYVTDYKAISYITNKKKTENYAFTEYFLCGENPFEASEKFMNTRRLGSGKSTILAQHLYQSFSPGEVTAEKAFEIGKFLADRYLNGEYQYVISTHVDKNHIHNHIVFCNTSYINFKTFETNENRHKEAWKHLQKISDDLCKANNLSVIVSPQTAEKGKGYYENSIVGEHLSWKSQIKIIVNAVVLQSDNFEDFLRKMREFGVQCEYKPDNVIKLKYRLQGQQKFTRARTLGQTYDVDGVTARIAKCKRFFEGKNIYVPHIPIIDTASETMRDNTYLERWAKVKNMKTVADLLLDLEKKGIGNIGELGANIDVLKSKRQSHIQQKNIIENKLAAFEVLQNNTLIYRKNKPIRDEYAALEESSAKQKKLKKDFYFSHQKELSDFKTAAQILRGYEFQDGKLPDIQKLQNSVNLTKSAIEDEKSQIKALSNSIGELSAISEALEKYFSPEKETLKRERDERERDEL